MIYLKTFIYYLLPWFFRKYYYVVFNVSGKGQGNSAFMFWGVGNTTFSIEEALSHIYYNNVELRDENVWVSSWHRISERDYAFIAERSSDQKKKRLREIATGLQQTYGYKGIDNARTHEI